MACSVLASFSHCEPSPSLLQPRSVGGSVLTAVRPSRISGAEGQFSSILPFRQTYFNVSNSVFRAMARGSLVACSTILVLLYKRPFSPVSSSCFWDHFMEKSLVPVGVPSHWSYVNEGGKWMVTATGRLCYGNFWESHLLWIGMIGANPEQLDSIVALNLTSWSKFVGMYWPIFQSWQLFDNCFRNLEEKEFRQDQPTTGTCQEAREVPRHT